MRPGRSVGKQKLDVVGARLAAVDPVRGTAPAPDSPHHLDRRAFVVGKRRVARGVVDRQRNFGEVARRAAARAGEDHIVHLAAAQPLGGGFAHHPAQRLDEIGFAAAIGSDNAGKARLDRQLGRLDKRFEAGEAKALYLHHRPVMFSGPS